jgi:hypothetical protein
VWEPQTVNNSRKNCEVWRDAHCCDPNCKKKVLVCPHRPMCYKEIPGVLWMEYVEKPEDYFKPIPSDNPLNHRAPTEPVLRLKGPSLSERSDEEETEENDGEVAVEEVLLETVA